MSKERGENMNNYLVIVENFTGKYYLTYDLEFRDGLSDDCVWDGKIWDENTIMEYIKDDSMRYGYTYKIIEF